MIGGCPLLPWQHPPPSGLPSEVQFAEGWGSLCRKVGAEFHCLELLLGPGVLQQDGTRILHHPSLNPRAARGRALLWEHKSPTQSLNWPVDICNSQRTVICCCFSQGPSPVCAFSLFTAFSANYLWEQSAKGLNGM